ncbi:hypothetical protein P3T37_004328 [Kitasatospora sp. MAA4]|uniref:hypothetical protein n=1 Tax=Kitasatospora sp. MAA4 TaxID=3035093 RepID=UPI0024751883|nr:hypothetical protein [Kitasatospora sp. MAA4]MDH6134919.1 hypothetical protein [Kitasatospora sp. MAA4]
MESAGWNWLKGQPPNWEAPENLRGPTSSWAVNLAVQMLGSNIIGNHLIELVAEFIAAKSRLELWMAQHEPPLALKQQFALGRGSADAVRIVYEAWVVYATAHQSARGKVAMVENEKAMLIEALSQATETLVRSRSDQVT